MINEDAITDTDEISKIVKAFYQLPMSQQMYTAATVLEAHCKERKIDPTEVRMNSGSFKQAAQAWADAEDVMRRKRKAEEALEEAKRLAEEKTEIDAIASAISLARGSAFGTHDGYDRHVAAGLYKQGFRIPRWEGENISAAEWLAERGFVQGGTFEHPNQEWAERNQQLVSEYVRNSSGNAAAGRSQWDMDDPNAGKQVQR